MTIIIPLDCLTTLKPGLAYSIDLEANPGFDDSGYVATVRPWRVTDVNPPVTVETETVADHVTLEVLPDDC